MDPNSNLKDRTNALGEPGKTVVETQPITILTLGTNPYDLPWNIEKVDTKPGLIQLSVITDGNHHYYMQSEIDFAREIFRDKNEHIIGVILGSYEGTGLKVASTIPLLLRPKTLIWFQDEVPYYARADRSRYLARGINHFCMHSELKQRALEMFPVS